jgi:cell division protein FtsB
VRRWLGLAAIVLVAYLYYHPLRTYFETRSQLGSRRAEVAQLAAQKRELQRRLEASTTVDSLAREARALGYVLPGEHLFIVKGIEAWRRAHTTLAPDGR